MSKEAEQATHFTCDFEERPDGNFIWHASLVLLKYLQEPERARQLRGRRVLELGSGLGHLGHGLARLGAHVTCTDQAKVVPVLEESLKELDAKDGPPADAGGSVRIVTLDWGEEGFAASEFAKEEVAFDVIISAELVYLEETHDLLLWCWDRFAGPDTVIYSAFINRPFSWNFFVKVHDSDLFEVDQLDDEKDFDPCGLEEVYLHVVTRKKG
mmetsp:Transcript_67100/g.148859  ORF Transcript_67100/g.148859 Transcript_67100/m.148859 type:complete len:212 (-) Transcript_67100:77-712(-)